MPEELYKILGIKPTASKADVREAYRSLAKKHHPDLNPGDKAAEETFKKLQGAYDILFDDEKRRQYDAGVIDGDGKETQRQFYREYAGANQDHPYQSSAGYEDLGNIFSDLFGDGRGPRGENIHIRMPGGDARYRTEVSFLEAVHGATKRVTLPHGDVLDVRIPPGHRDGQILRLRGKGMPGLGGGAPGDAYVEVQVRPHDLFRRRGSDILVDLPVGIHEAVLGAKVTVPTVHGPVTMTIPKGSNTGSTLRLKGKGVPAHGKHEAGDQLVSLRVTLPTEPDSDLAKFLEGWAKDHAYDPRSAKEA